MLWCTFKAMTNHLFIGSFILRRVVIMELRVSIMLCLLLCLTGTISTVEGMETSGIQAITATVDEHNTETGSFHANDGPAKGQSNFPERPELYVPVPLPQYVDISEFPEPENKMVSYDLVTGEEVVYESLAREGGPNSGKAKGGVGAGRLGKRNIGTTVPYLTSSIKGGFSNLSQVTNPEDDPWNKNVKLFIIANDLNGNGQCNSGEGCYVCSGTLIDPKHVLTAGHCVHEGDGGDWFDAFTVVPAYENGRAPYGDARGVQPYSWTGWTGYGYNTHDIGVIRLDRPIGALTGWHGYGHDNNPSFYYSHTFHNPGYPGESYDGQYMYYWRGDFDFFWGRNASIYKRSYNGQSGSGAYHIEGGSEYIYTVLSNGTSSTTNFIRITSGKYEDIQDSYIGENTPSSTDLIPLDVAVEPRGVIFGRQLASMKYLVHNYSSETWDGTIYADVYLSTNDNITSFDTRIQRHHFDTSISPKSSVRINVSDPPTIPASTSPGTYYLGVILDISDHNTGNNDTDGQDADVLRVFDCNPPDSPPNITYPINDCDGSFTVNWDHVSGGLYTLQRATNSSFTDAVHVVTWHTNHYEESDLEEGQYYYRVKTHGSCEESNWREGHILYVDPSISPESIDYPREVCSDSFRVQWSGIGWASIYLLERATNSSFTDAEMIYYGTSTYYEESGLEPGGYYYRVRRTPDCGAPIWRKGDLINIRSSAPATPDYITYPSTDDDGSFGVRWDKVTGAMYYRVEKAMNDSFTSDLDTLYTGRSGFCTQKDLGSGTYFYRVRAENSCGYGGWKEGEAINIDRGEAPSSHFWLMIMPAIQKNNEN